MRNFLQGEEGLLRPQTQHLGTTRSFAFAAHFPTRALDNGFKKEKVFVKTHTLSSCHLQEVSVKKPMGLSE
jgi:hypothetical protein